MTEAQLFTIAIIGLLITPLVTLITTVLVQVFTWVMSVEQRKRDLEDRREVVKQAKLATEAAAKASQITTKGLEVVHTEVVKVGQQATAAYTEANNANIKIQAVQDVLTEALHLPQKEITNMDTQVKG